MKRYLSPIMLLAVFIVYTISIKFVDVAPIGPEGTSVGMASINGAIANMFAYNDLCYNISKVLGIAAFLVVAIFAVLGLIELIKRKSFKKVDAELYILGCFYVLVALVYVIFEKVIINYRPIIVDIEEGLEASYPSTHTMLAVCVFGSAAIMLNKYIKDKNALLILQIACIVMLTATVVTRLISGVHWFTDIVGGVILSMTLLSMFIVGVSGVRKED